MSAQPGWQPDPYGRFEQRYYDGTKWTEHVATAGRQQVDPLGASLAIPFALPSTAIPGGAQPSTLAATGVAESRPGWRRFLDGFGPEARQRPRPDAVVVLAGLGGLLLAAGILVLAADGTNVDEGNVRAKLAIYSVVITVAALGVRLFVRHQPALRSAAVSAGAVGISGIVLAIAWDHFDASGYLLLLVACYLAAWLLPGFRGRPLMLGLAALALVAFFGNITSSNHFGSGSLPNAIERTVGNQATVFLVLGALLLVLVFLLDRAGYAGIATSLVVAGLIAIFGGVAQSQSLDNLDGSGEALLVLLVGIVVCVVGGHGHRRATLWLGAGVATIGLTALLLSWAEPRSVKGFAGVFLLSGGLLIVSTIVIEVVRANRAAPPSTGSSLSPPVVQ